MVFSHLRAVALLVSMSGVALAQVPRTGPAASASAKPALTEAEFARIEQLGAVALSPDGKWVAYDFRRGASGPTELRYRAVSGGEESSVPLGNNPIFSANGRWLLFVLSPDTSMARLGGAGRRGGTAVAGRGGASAEANHNKVGIVDLRSGTKTVLSDMQSFALSKDGAHVALRRYAAADTHAHGADVVVRDLEQGTDLTLGNVTDFAWNDDGSLLAMIVDVEGKAGNGVQLLNVATGALRPLDTGDHQYVGLSWRKHGSDLAVLRSRADSAFADTGYTVLAWRGLSGARASKVSYEFADDRAFPAGMRVSASRSPLWADDSSTVFFGIAPRDPKVSASWNGAPPARVEVWHWKDLREYHQQDRQASQDRQKTQLAAWRLADNRVMRLADDTLDAVTLADGQRIALTSDERPYFTEQISGRPYRDIYRVDPATGQRERIIVKTAFPAATSPGGRYVLFAQGGHWWTYDVTNKARVNLTARIPSAFVNMEDDHPVHERRPYGIGGWTTGDRSVILYDRYDLWQVAPDGSHPMRLTRGREDSTVYRIEMLDPDLRAIDPAKPLTLSATGDWNKKSGYARLTIGQPAQRLLWVDKSVTRLIQAKNAPNVYAYVSQSAEEPPNVFVTTTSLADARQISHTNAFLGDYAWGKQVVMELRQFTWRQAPDDAHLSGEL